jgi:hypothetical protein
MLLMRIVAQEDSLNCLAGYFYRDRAGIVTAKPFLNHLAGDGVDKPWLPASPVINRAVKPLPSGMGIQGAPQPHKSAP